MVAIFRASLVILLCCLFNSCGQRGSNPEEARIKLTQMNITYSEDSFFNKVQEGDVLAVKLFLQAGMDPNLKNKFGLTPLIVAARAGRLKVLKLLVDNGADLHIKLENGNDALDLATDRGHKDVEQFLIKKGLTPTYDINAMFKQIELFNEYKRKGIDPPANDVIQFNNKYNNYIKQSVRIHHLMYSGSVDAIKSLIDQGIMINSIDLDFGNTLLMNAILLAPQKDILPLVRILVENGSNFNVKNKLGWSPLLLALARHRKGNDIRIKLGQLGNPDNTPPSLNDKHMLPWELKDPVIEYLISAGAKNDF